MKLTANKTMQTTITTIIIKHAARFPALRWYSDAVCSSSAAPLVSTATDDMFDDDLSGQELWTPADLEIPVYHTETGKSETITFFYLNISSNL